MVLIERRENQYGEIQACVFHRELGFVESLLLLAVLNLRLHYVAVSGLPGAFLILSDVEKALRLIESLLGGRIPSLGHYERIVCFRDGHGQAASRNFGLGLRNRLGRLRAMDAREQVSARRKVLVQDGPLPVHVDAIVGDKPSLGNVVFSCTSRTLRVQVLGRVADRGQHGAARLDAIFPGDFGVSLRREKLRIVFAGSFKRVP
jgi:hypothetical protein